ncbi:MAG: alpha/beta hydrolase [Verrucomicrobiota bacterium]
MSWFWPDRSEWMRVAMRFLILWPLVIYVALLFMLTTFKDSLIYPGADMYRHLSLQDSEFTASVAKKNLEVWRSPQGEYLGLKREVEDPERIWLIFYGNGDVSIRASGWFDFLGEFFPDRRLSFYVLEYPGYGPQEGVTSEETILVKAKQALDLLNSQSLPITILGQSMGAGVACRLAKESGAGIDGLLLCNPYTSLIDAGYQYLSRIIGPLNKLVPLEAIVKDRYQSIENIRSYEGPVVIVAGEEDTLTPAKMAEKLYEVVAGCG